MNNIRFKSIMFLGGLSVPNTAYAYCVMPSVSYDKFQSALAWASYENCVQQERQGEQQRYLAEQQRQQMERQRQQMELQRRQMEAQTLEMQRQSRIQEQQLQTQQRQLESQKQMQSYSAAPSNVVGLNAYIFELSKKYNAQLPLQFDNVTKLIRVDAGNSTLTMVHQISYEVDTQDRINTMASIIGPKACSDPETLRNINVYRVKYVYRYFMPSGRNFDIFMNPGSC